MPLRPFCREQVWLLPPSLEEMVPAADHPARVVAAFVDALDATAWAELAIEVQGDPLGAPAYHPRAVLSVWVVGLRLYERGAFGTQARSSLPGPVGLSVVDRVPEARSQHLMALLQSQP